MPNITIYRAHELTFEQALQTADYIASQLAEHFEIQAHWEGNSLYFERPGINGQIDLEPGELRLNAQLGLLLTPLKSHLEQEIHQHLDSLLKTPT
ncbi:MAG: poly(3-hydroxybutyrate) depolymerase [Candidatus Contendobacter odensis]|uniref:Poly(3-hydroxybutyrate) depolymerase n=1 Tax=Candidatus Contendibacter odensensis TaxID=1400860 RepID=A0A2G6PEP9_9GAMM|nr:MAG: poly(3-hydroxybutyrate) depolymerase [Candidatus Contendobacter odensis]